MKMDEDMQKRVQTLQILEQNFQNILLQKQTFQVELNEASTALGEVEKSSQGIFRVLGQVMLKADKEELKKELKEKKDVLDLRMKSIEKQEFSLREEIERIRGEIMSGVE